MWNIPGPEIEPVSPALTGRFLTSGPLGKSSNIHLNGFKNVGESVKVDGDQGQEGG